MWRTVVARVTLLVSAAVVSGCLPSIGDSCRVDVDCSQLGDRVCDTSQPGGYCSQFNCDPTSCPPEESICVAFSTELSPVLGCRDPNREAPYERNFCMRACLRQEDCRPGYECIDVGAENPWSAQIVQKDPHTTKICMVPASSSYPDPQLLSDLPENVCRGADPGGWGGAGGATDE